MRKIDQITKKIKEIMPIIEKKYNVKNLESKETSGFTLMIFSKQSGR